MKNDIVKQTNFNYCSDDILNIMKDTPLTGQHWWSGWWNEPYRNIWEETIQQIWEPLLSAEDIKNLDGFDYWKNDVNADIKTGNSAMSWHRDCDEHLRVTRNIVSSPEYTSILYIEGIEGVGGDLEIKKSKENMDMPGVPGIREDEINNIPSEIVSFEKNKLLIIDAGYWHRVQPLNEGRRVSFLSSPWESKPMKENFEQNQTTKYTEIIEKTPDDNPLSFEEMCKKYLSPGILYDDPGLILTKKGPEIYSFPLFNAEFCKILINKAETSGLYGRGDQNNHENYNAPMIHLDDIGYGEFYRKVIKTYIHNICKYVWRMDYSSENIVSEDFLIKYTPDTQAGLGVHSDFSQFTIVLTLNNDFKGGGTIFPRQEMSLIQDIGEATIHPGMLTHPHGGIPITEGKRFILVTFCWETFINNDNGNFKK